MYKAIFFDVDDTLIDFSRSSTVALRDTFAAVGHEMDDGSERVFHEINNELWHKVELAQIERAQIYETRFALVFDRLGLKGDSVESDALFRRRLCEVAIPVFGAKELLCELSTRYALYAASNAPYSQQVQRLALAGLSPYIREIFTSDSIGATKPSFEFFKGCFAKLPYSPSEALMVGDSPKADIEGAVNFGMGSCFFDRFKKGLPQGIKADFTVNDLPSIASILSR